MKGVGEGLGGEGNGRDGKEGERGTGRKRVRERRV